MQRIKRINWGFMLAIFFCFFFWGAIFYGLTGCTVYINVIDHAGPQINLNKEGRKNDDRKRMYRLPKDLWLQDRQPGERQAV